jgi:hypothetical protein
VLAIQNDPPGAPAEGARYIVGTAGTGAWAEHDNAIAEYSNGEWIFSSPTTGVCAYVIAVTEYYSWNGAAWVMESFRLHASTHAPGGSDPMAVDAAAGTGSLRTLGTGATAACAGNDSRLADTRTPTDSSVTDAKVNASAGITISKIADGKFVQCVACIISAEGV